MMELVALSAGRCGSECVEYSESWNQKMESQRKLKTTQKDIKTF